jgi:hypothetical protein
MRFISNKVNTEWKRFFAFLPVEAGTVGDKTIKIWLEYAEFRYVPRDKEWCNAIWECRPLDVPAGFVANRQTEGQWV